MLLKKMYGIPKNIDKDTVKGLKKLSIYKIKRKIKNFAN